MENKYFVLQKLAELVREDPHPTQYKCIPRQLILLLPSLDWPAINAYLDLLEEERLVLLKKTDSNYQFSITTEGLDRIRQIQSERRGLDGKRM